MRSMARGVRTPKIRTWPRWRPCMAYKLIWTHAHAHALVTRVTVTGWRSMRREHAIRRIYTFRLQADRHIHRVPSYIIRHVPVPDLFPARASFLVSAPDHGYYRLVISMARLSPAHAAGTAPQSVTLTLYTPHHTE